MIIRQITGKTSCNIICPAPGSLTGRGGKEHLVTLLIGFHRHRQNFGGTNQIGEVHQMYNIQRASLSDHIYLMYWSHDQYRLDTPTHINFFAEYQHRSMAVQTL